MKKIIYFCLFILTLSSCNIVNDTNNIVNDTKYKDLYKQTDYFIACSIPEFDDHIIWFVRKKDDGWFSMSIQSDWQGGYLDVDGECYQRMVDEGYTYSERI